VGGVKRRFPPAMVDRVLVYADGRVVIEGMLDGSEAAQFDLANCSIAALCYNSFDEAMMTNYTWMDV
jgi:hypothetical protein